MTITADQVNVVEGAKKELFNCTTIAAVKKVFEDYNLLDVGAKTALLHNCMQVRNVYTCSDNHLTEDEFYEETLRFFEDGQWRGLI